MTIANMTHPDKETELKTPDQIAEEDKAKLKEELEEQRKIEKNTRWVKLKHPIIDGFWFALGMSLFAIIIVIILLIIGIIPTY